MSETLEIDGVYQSKARRLSEQMLTDIREGCFQNRRNLPSELELGRHYGASRATIRRVISFLISNGTLDKEPNKTAKIVAPSSVRKDSGAVPQSPEKTISMAMVYAAAPDGFIVGTSEGAKAFCRENHCDLQFFTNESGHEKTIEMLDHAFELGIDGVIVLPYETEAYRNAIGKLQRIGFPIVCLDRPLKGMELNSVEVDNAGGVYLSTTTLITRFGRPVYYLGAVPTHSTQQMRLNGFKMAMHEAGYSADIADYLLLYPSTDNDPEYWPMSKMSHPPYLKMSHPPYLKMREFLESAELPVSVVCMNDYVALGVYEAARDLNLRIGIDIMVCGFDDLPMARLQHPPLSSIEQPRHRIGYEAADLLYKTISGKLKQTMNLRLPVELHERESTFGIAE